MKEFRIGTRGSELAMWQASHVAGLLQNLHPQVRIEVVPITTEGDRRLDVSLSQLGGKGLFIKELERCLLEDRIDIAVHSMKDVTVNLDPEFCIDVILERANPYDALVSNHFDSLDSLPENAVIGTCSLRRQSQLKSLRPDLQFVTLRGNVPTRLKRLDSGEFDAIVLAVSGLTRLGREGRITQILNGEHHIPSPGQGAMGIECRSRDSQVQEFISPLNHETTSIAVNAERLTNRALGGSCVVPVGIHTTVGGERMKMGAFIGSLDGSECIRSTIQGKISESEKLAKTLADDLEQRGARKILDACN